MKKIIAAFYIIFFITQQATFAETDNTFWESYQDILNSAVTVNTFTSIDGEFGHASVDYEKIKNDSELQEKISLQLEKLKTVKAPEEEKHKLAFWINAYNLFTIVDVVNNYPIASKKKSAGKTSITRLRVRFIGLMILNIILSVHLPIRVYILQ